MKTLTIKLFVLLLLFSLSQKLEAKAMTSCNIDGLFMAQIPIEDDTIAKKHRSKKIRRPKAPKAPKAPKVRRSAKKTKEYSNSPVETPETPEIPETPETPEFADCSSSSDQVIISRKGSKIKTMLVNLRPFSANSSIDNLEIEYNGEIHVTDNDRGIKSISKGGYLHITKSSFGNKRKIEIEGKSNGTVERKYFEGKTEKPYDTDGKAFLADVLPTVLRATGIDAKERTARIFTLTGIEGFINEIKKIESNSVKRIYFENLWGNQNLNKNQNIRAVEALASYISSNSNRGIIFRKIDEKFMKDEEMSDAYFRSLAKLSSNSERGYTLRHTIKNNNLSTPQLEQFFNATGKLSSNSERGSTLRKVDQVNFDKLSTVEAYFTNIGKMESNTERGLTLRDRLDKQVLNKKAMMGLLYCTQRLSSNSERGMVLRKAIDQIQEDSEVMEIFLNTVAKMTSNSERGLVLRKLVKKGTLKPETYVGILNTAAKLSSNSEKTSVIISVCKTMPKDNETVIDAYKAATKTITSNSDYRYAMDCLDK